MTGRNKKITEALKSWDFARIPLFIRRKSYIQHTSTAHLIPTAVFRRDLRIIDRTLELCQGIHLSEDAACIIPGSLSQECASGQCHCKLQGTKRNPIETPKSPALISLRSGSTNILIRASAIFIASIRTCLGYKACEVIFIPSYFDKTNP